jgi:hypothetical protein
MRPIGPPIFAYQSRELMRRKIKEPSGFFGPLFYLTSAETKIAPSPYLDNLFKA